MSRPITQSRSRTRSAQTVCLSMMALMALGLLLIGPVAVPAQAQERAPLIVGVTTNLGQAVAALRAQGVPVRHVIDVSSAVAVVGDASRLRGLPFVRYVEPDPPDAVWIVQDSLPYGVANIDAEVVWGGSQGATDVIAGQGGWGIKVAVIDTGVDCSHADLVGGCAYGANFVNAALALDDHGHGTHVAGTIGARDNGQGVIGVAPEVELYAVKVLDANGSGSWSAVAAGINWAVQNGMNVISMSLGGTAGSQAVADAVAAADAAGILVVSAAGNSGCCNTVLYPAKYPESMPVAAVGPARSVGFVLLDRSRGRRGRAGCVHLLDGADRLLCAVRPERLQEPERHVHGDAACLGCRRAAHVARPVERRGAGAHY